MDASKGQKSGAARASRDLALTGALTAFVYVTTAAFYARGFQGYSRTAREVFIWLAVLPLLYLFARGYGIVRDAGEELRGSSVVWFAALFCGACVLVYPFHSTDIFGYINRGWQQVHYHLNPYVYTVAEVPGWREDPMVWEHWIYNPNPYGFLFTLLTRALCYLGAGNWTLTLLLFKLVNAGAYAFTGWLVWSGARRLGHARPLLALYSFLWNPLVLLHHIANGHNDVLIGCALALAAYLVVTESEVWIVPALAAATMLKYAPALLVPFALVYVYRKRGWKTAGLGLLLGTLLVVVTAAPYLADWRQFRLEDIQDNATLIDNSLHSFLIHLFENAARLVRPLAQFHDALDSTIKAALRVGFALCGLYLFARFWVKKESSAEGLVRVWTLVLLVLLLAASSKFNAWYMGMVLPLALFLPERHPLRRVALLVTCAQTLSLTFFKQAYILNYFAMVLVPLVLVMRRMRRERAAGRFEEEPTAALPSS